MPDRLPIELLRSVLSFATPPAHTERTYVERQNTLQSCCLVCRTWRDLAQPLLWRVVFLKSSFQASRLQTAMREDSGRTLMEQTRTFGATASDKFDDLPRLWCLFRRFRRAQKVLVRGFEHEVDAAELERHSELRELHLTCVGIFDLPFTLPTLTELTLIIVEIARERVSILFSSYTFPSLKALSITEMANSADAGFFYPSMPARFEEQLELLQVTGAPVSDALSVASRAAPFLYTLSASKMYGTLFELDAQCPPHLRLVADASSEEGEDWGVIEAILAACKEQGIDVLWHSFKPGEEPAISTQFWDYAKERKEKRERAEQASEQG
ncbi:hypothetical protein JCM10213_001763 [Rhodosporidiobolus nylandii]